MYGGLIIRLSCTLSEFSSWEAKRWNGNSHKTNVLECTESLSVGLFKACKSLNHA